MDSKFFQLYKNVKHYGYLTNTYENYETINKPKETKLFIPQTKKWENKQQLLHHKAENRRGR